MRSILVTVDDTPSAVAARGSLLPWPDSAAPR